MKSISLTDNDSRLDFIIMDRSHRLNGQSAAGDLSLYKTSKLKNEIFMQHFQIKFSFGCYDACSLSILWMIMESEKAASL
ncbi:hypothetical protein D3C81_2184540 [compost metagenome]